MRDICNIFAPHCFEALHFRHVLKQSGNADTLPSVRYDRSDCDPQRFIPCHWVGNALGLPGFKYLIKGFPNFRIGDKLFPLFNIDSPKHAHQGRVVMRQHADFVGRCNAVRQALQNLIQLAFFRFKLIDRL